MKKTLIFIAAMAAFLASASMAQAGWEAYTTADVNMREGPGNQYRIIVVIPEGEPVYVHGCPGSWCDVEWDSYRGYVFWRYLSSDGSGYYKGYVAPPVIVVPEYDGGYIHAPRKRKLRRYHRPRQYHERPSRPRKQFRRLERPRAMKQRRERRSIRQTRRHQMQQANPRRHQQRLERRRNQGEGHGSPHLQRKRRKLQD